MKRILLAVVMAALSGACAHDRVMSSGHANALAQKSESAEVLYLQNFLVAPDASGDVPFTVDHWYFQAGVAAQTPPARSPATGSGMPGAGLSAAPTDVAPAGPQTHASGRGTLDSRTWYYAGINLNYLGNGICWTTEYPVDLKQTAITAITWYHRDTLDRGIGDGNSVGGERVVLRMDGRWYLAPKSDRISGPGTGSNDQWWLDTFTFTTAGWLKLDFLPGGRLDQTITSSTHGNIVLPLGTIDAIGLYQIAPPGALVRFDTFAIYGKPRP